MTNSLGYNILTDSEQQHPKMSARMRKLLREGNDGTYRDDFAVDSAIILALINEGRNESYIHSVIRERGPYYQEILTRRPQWLPNGVVTRPGKYGPEAADRYFRKLYAKELRYHQQNPPRRSKAEMSARLAEHLAWLESLGIWTGRRGSRNFDVLRTLVKRAQQLGSSTVGYSIRRLGSDSGRTHQPVIEALHDLERDGYIHQAGRTIGEYTYEKPLQYTILRLGESVFGTPTNNGYPITWGGDAIGSPAEQVFHRDCLGPTARRLYGLLSPEEGTSNKALVKATRLAASTVSENLHKLLSAGLANKLDGTWIRTDANLADIAVALGAGKRQAVLEDRNAKERTARRRAIEARRVAIVQTAIAQRPEARPELPAPKIAEVKPMQKGAQPGTPAVLYSKNKRIDGVWVLDWHYPPGVQESRQRQHLHVVSAEAAQQYQEGAVYDIDLSVGIAA